MLQATEPEGSGRDFPGQRDPGDENYFMPKVRLQRPDGASLIDVYNSKRNDTWSKILKAQLREEEDETNRKKKVRDVCMYVCMYVCICV